MASRDSVPKAAARQSVRQALEKFSFPPVLLEPTNGSPRIAEPLRKLRPEDIYAFLSRKLKKYQEGGPSIFTHDDLTLWSTHVNALVLHQLQETLSLSSQEEMRANDQKITEFLDATRHEPQKESVRKTVQADEVVRRKPGETLRHGIIRAAKIEEAPLKIKLFKSSNRKR